MAEKSVIRLQNIDHADIWYCEAGSKRLFIGLVKSGDNQAIVRVVAETFDEAWTKMAESGDVLIAEPMREIISDFVVDARGDGPIL